MKDLLARTPDIASMEPYWDKVSALLKGYDAVKNSGELFLARFPNEQDDDYDLRLTKTKLTNVFRDVIEGLASKPFQNEVAIVKGDDADNTEIPQYILDFVEDVDGAGNNLTMFSALTFFNGIGYGIDWILVDYPTVVNAEGISVSEAKKKNIKPYWVHILGKNVLEIHTRMEGSKEKLTYFRYKEPSYPGQPERVRIYSLNEDGKVHWGLFEEPEKKDDDWIMIAEGIMTIDEIPLVPFVVGRRNGSTWELFPPMRDTVDLQMVLYENESALEYIKMLACYPMLATNGMKPSKNADGKTSKVSVGPNRVLYGLQTQDGRGGDWKYVEPNANSLEFLQKNIEKTKQDLRELGRQPLTALSTQLTTVTTSIAAGKAKSAVTAWVYALKDTLENALRLTVKWMGKPEYEPQVNIYTGFDNVNDDGSDLEELGKARERGDLSRETYWAELKRRKILSAEFNAEAETKRLLDEIPSYDAPDIDDNLNQEDNLNGMEN